MTAKITDGTKNKQPRSFVPPVLRYECLGCGELDTIAEFSLVPREVTIDPDGDGGFDYGDDKAYWEAELSQGFGCKNTSCKNYPLNTPIATGYEQGKFVDDPSKIANIVKE